MRTALALLAILCLAPTGMAGAEDQIRTDANIVTGLDVSGSIEAPETQIQIEGMVMAIRSQDVIRAIRSGRHGRIGFAVFVWANGSLPVFAGWRLIGSEEEALAVSVELDSRLRAILGSGAPHRLGELTDLSGAMAYGGAMLEAAPYGTDRSILNILGNGLDNVGEGPRAIRDQLVTQGVTVNAVVVGHDRGVISYFRREVMGGRRAFILTAGNPKMLAEIVERKFVTEIVLATPPRRSQVR